MGLHNRTRDYLYKSFVKKNYQGLSQKEINSLLAINPDDFLNYQENRANYESFLSDYENLLSDINFTNKTKSLLYRLILLIPSNNIWELLQTFWYHLVSFLIPFLTPKPPHKPKTPPSTPYP